MPCSYKASEKETKHITPLSKGGEGSERPCSYKANEKETKHTTPLSPWRGAGGEAGSGGEADSGGKAGSGGEADSGTMIFFVANFVGIHWATFRDVLNNSD